MKICKCLGRGVSAHDCDSVEEVRDPNNSTQPQVEPLSAAAVAAVPMRFGSNETILRSDNLNTPQLFGRKAGDSGFVWPLIEGCFQTCYRSKIDLSQCAPISCTTIQCFNSIHVAPSATACPRVLEH